MKDSIWNWLTKVNHNHNQSCHMHKCLIRVMSSSVLLFVVWWGNSMPRIGIHASADSVADVRQQHVNPHWALRPRVISSSAQQHTHVQYTSWFPNAEPIKPTIDSVIQCVYSAYTMLTWQLQRSKMIPIIITNRSTQIITIAIYTFGLPQTAQMMRLSSKPKR